MEFTKLQGVAGDRIGAVMREFTEDDWRDAQAFLNLVMLHHGTDQGVYAKVLELSGADTTGVDDMCAAGYGLAQRIRDRLTND